MKVDMPDSTWVNRPEAKSTLTGFFHDTPSSLKKRQRKCEDKRNNSAEGNSVKGRPSKRSKIVHQDGEYNGQNDREKKIAQIQAGQPTTGTWAPIQLTEYIAKVNKWASDKDANDSQLTRARESFLTKIDDSIKVQAQEEYGLADVNGVAFYAASVMLDELNELDDDQYIDLRTARTKIATFEYALADSEQKERSTQALLEKRGKLVERLETRESLLAEAVNDAKDAAARRGFAQGMLRRTLKADCDEKAKVIAELKTTSAQKEDRIVQLEDTVQNLLSRVSVLEKLKVGKDTEVLRLKRA
jgi:hypothetical protein